MPNSGKITMLAIMNRSQGAGSFKTKPFKKNVSQIKASSSCCIDALKRTALVGRIPGGDNMGLLNTKLIDTAQST
ncbi:MAG: hypothetical protein DHS20C08_12040 [Rhodomicrobium sp.]|nr:MAG: hypothetical protein DHS20C08_12040 [Rhodomicrobium sp.]